jgi:DNA-binding NarL/FixJ family response regulator
MSDEENQEQFKNKRENSKTQSDEMLEQSATKPTIKLLLVEDDTLARVGLKTVLKRAQDLQVIGEAANGQEAIKLVEDYQADVILMDINMPVLNGIQATREILARLPDIRIIMLTHNDNDQDILAALDAGASGYCLKNIEPDRLYTAIRTVSSGYGWFDSALRTSSHTQRNTTQEQRRKLQKQREELFEKRERLLQQEDNGETEADLERLQDEIQQLQQEILSLQMKSHGQQEVVNKLRRLADQYGDELKQSTPAYEDTQTKKENMQTMQENVQRLREDLQRQREEWKKLERQKQDKKRKGKTN